MKQTNKIVLFLATALFLLAGCAGQLDKKKQSFENHGVSYEMQLPSGWKEDQEHKLNYGLQTDFSAEDTKSNSYLFITSTPVAYVDQKGFGEATREKLKERYNYKKAKDIYMKEFKVGSYPTYKYTLNTKFEEKIVWAHFYYIWTEHGFVQMTFYSADDNSYKKRSVKIDAAVDTFKEVSFDETKSKQVQEKQKKEEGDIVTIENNEIKMEITAVRQVTGENKQKLLAIRYTFSNLNKNSVQPAIWKELVTAKQNEVELPVGKLPEDTTLLDVLDLVKTQSEVVQKGDSLESVVLYELSDNSTVELSYSKEAFPDIKPTRVVVPE